MRRLCGDNLVAGAMKITSVILNTPNPTSELVHLLRYFCYDVNMKKILTLIAIFIIAPASSVQAHSGRTDANGGHNCYVGACAGTYHYHNGGGSPPAPPVPRYVAPKPRVPVVRTTTVTREESIGYKQVSRIDYREYPDYIRKINDGRNGKRVITTNIITTDGKESGRSDVKNEVVIQPEDEVTVKGGRSVSRAKFYGIAQAPSGLFSSNKNKYNIWGKYDPNVEVYMTVEGKKTRAVKTNSEGWFTFEKIKITKGKSWLHLFLKKNNNVSSVSEKTQADLNAKKLTTEYDLIHTQK